MNESFTCEHHAPAPAPAPAPANSPAPAAATAPTTVNVGLINMAMDSWVPCLEEFTDYFKLHYTTGCDNLHPVDHGLREESLGDREVRREKR